MSANVSLIRDRVLLLWRPTGRLTFDIIACDRFWEPRRGLYPVLVLRTGDAVSRDPKFLDRHGTLVRLVVLVVSQDRIRKALAGEKEGLEMACTELEVCRCLAWAPKDKSKARGPEYYLITYREPAAAFRDRGHGAWETNERAGP